MKTRGRPRGRFQEIKLTSASVAPDWYMFVHRANISCSIYTPALAQEDCEQHTCLSFFFENRVSKIISILCLKNDIIIDFNLAPRVVKPFSS